MYNVAVIGVGQIGSRHLQALAKSNLDVNIYAVDPSLESRKIAKERFEQIDATNAVKSSHYIESISELPDELEMVVIATSSKIRYRVAEELLQNKNVKFLILEKVLFQSISEYEMFTKLVHKRNAKCWVNHPRRMYPLYSELKEKLKGKDISYRVNGGDWGLACNSLHFLDVFSFLIGEKSIDLDFSCVENEVIPSKRDGYIELYGEIKGSAGNSSISLLSKREQMPFHVTILSEDFVAYIDEVSGFMRVSTKNEIWNWEVKEEQIIHFQSDLTNKVFESLVNSGECDLTSYEESQSLHKKFIRKTLEKIKDVNNEILDHCPIT